jgi:hypothetical protein
MTDITTIDGCGGQEFRDYVLRNPNTLVYSEPRFLKLVANQLKARCVWLVARQAGQITGLLPFLVKEGPLGPAFNSLAYYGSNGGVIQAENQDDTKFALVNAFYNMAVDSGAVSATIISNPLEGDSEFYDSYVRHDYRDERIGQITHLPTSDEDLIASFEDPRPRNIRRAIKEGVTVAKGGIEDLHFLYSTHLDNMTKIGGLAKKREFFYAIPAEMNAEEWSVFTASLDGRPIASLLLLYFNRTVEYITPVVLESYRNTQALSLVIYEAMRDAINGGFSNWNWGGTWVISQSGVYDFKRRWNTSEYRYFYYTRLMNEKLMSCNPEYIMNHYSGFFVIPFSNLAGD